MINLSEAFSLTKNEREIMELMWSQQKPLSRSDIIDLSPERSWKASSIHILLNKMLDKSAITVDGFERMGRSYGRTFSPAVSEEEYMIMQLKQSSSYLQSKSSVIKNIMSALIKDGEVDDELIEELEVLLKERKEHSE